MHVPFLIAVTSALFCGPQSPIRSPAGALLRSSGDHCLVMEKEIFGMGEEEGETCAWFFILHPSPWGRPSALETAELKTPKNLGGEEPVSLVGSRRGAFPWLGGVVGDLW